MRNYMWICDIVSIYAVIVDLRYISYSVIGCDILFDSHICDGMIRRLRDTLTDMTRDFDVTDFHEFFVCITSDISNHIKDGFDE